MTAPPLTPSPYLRDHLLTAARGLRKDAEAARLNLAEAEQDVAAARELLREAEAQEARARAEVDGLRRDIAWAEEQAAARTAEIDAAAAAHRAGIVPVREELTPGGEVPYTDVPDPDLPGMWEQADFSGGWADTEADRAAVPPVNVARTPEQVIAALTGGIPITPPPTPDEPGAVVATSGPGATGPLSPVVTAPDPGLAHPVPNPPGPDDGADRPRHAKPSRWTGGWPVIGRRKPTDQDGDQQ